MSTSRITENEKKELDELKELISTIDNTIYDH